MNGQIDLRQLRYFVAVAEEQHFGRAAERLGMAQPPLSQSILRLEQQVGCALFTRRPRVRLTAAGEALLAGARRTLAQVEAGVDAARRAGRGEAGRLTVGFAASVVPGVFPGIVRAYREAYPGVELRLRELATAAQTDALCDGTIDVGFLRQPAEHPELACEPLLREPFAAVLPPRHPLGSTRTVRLQALAGEPFVHFPRAVAPTLHDQVNALCAAAGFTPRIVQEAQEWLTIVGLVEAGLGVSVVPASFRRLRWGGVVYRPLAPVGVVTTVSLCWRRADLSPTAAAFVQMARARTPAEHRV
jgi:DNA-binding transcriptional LysR family regulator